ncbi:MAG: efflux RND transporter permease subunit [Verrucomicrobia bacterium]|nr:efflux RND transporter permease subunit [Verrucomicrobiota bacterium]
MSREGFTSAIPRFSVSRPVTVVMLLLAIVVVGYIAYTRVRLSLFPEDLEGSQLHVSVSYPNASPRDIEEKITRKVEDIIGTVPDVRRITSYASPGYSYTRVEFQTGINLREAYAALSDRMDRVKPLLPDDVDRIYVLRYDPSTEPMMNLVAQVPRDMDDAAYRLENFVKPALQRIDGVGNVDIWGVQSREINLDLIDQRLRSHRIDVPAMLSALRSQNIAISGGYVYEAGRKIYVRSLGRFTTLDQIRGLIIDPVRKLRVADVANVSFRLPRREWVYRVDRQPAIGLQITRDSTGNIDRISRDVRATLQELARMPQLAGVKFEIFSDQGKDVRDAIEHLKEAGLWGGLFAALVIYIFLRAPRMTGILTLAIPLSLLCTIISLFFFGWSLNLATMMGLLLAVGMVVDNAIVIVENIYRLRQEGMEGTQASIVGTGEVGLAVVMSTCTTIVVFLPLILMGKSHEFSFWMLRIGVPVIVSLLASLFIALVFVPLAAQRLSRGQRHEDIAPVAWVRERYSRALRWVLTHRLDAVIIVLLAVGTIWYPYSNVQRSGGGLMGRSGRSMHLYYDLPSGSTIEQADEFFTKMEAFLEGKAALYGIERIETRFRNNNGRIQLKLIQKANDAWYVAAWEALLLSLDLAKPPMDRNDIEVHIRDNFELPAGIICRSIQRNAGAPQDTVIGFSIFGEDTSTLIDLAEEASRRLRTIPGMLSVDTDMERGGQELRIQLDRDRSRRLGINPQDVSNAISNTIRGLEVGRMPVPDGREVRIYAQLGEADRTRIDDVKTMAFGADSGMDVPLESIANLSVSKAMSTIYRESRQTVMRITARVPRQDYRTLNVAIDKAMEGFEMPRGYRFDRGYYFGQSSRDEQAMQFALTLAVIFVFLLMGLLFESFILPLAVIIAVPFSMLGVYWTLHLTKTPLDMMATIGIVILVGVVVNNAIVLVDMTNRLRAAGKNRFDALMDAGRHRFRPILMTTLTTVCGMIPMAVGNSKIIGVPYAPLGRTMIGGLLVSTLLTLLVVPLFYTLLDDLREHAARVWQAAFGERTPKSSGGGAGGELVPSAREK